MFLRYLGKRQSDEQEDDIMRTSLYSLSIKYPKRSGSTSTKFNVSEIRGTTGYDRYDMFHIIQVFQIQDEQKRMILTMQDAHRKEQASYPSAGSQGIIPSGRQFNDT